MYDRLKEPWAFRGWKKPPLDEAIADRFERLLASKKRTRIEMQKTDSKNRIERKPEQMASLSGGRALGIYRPGFHYKKESMQYFKSCVGEDVYSKAMSCDAGRAHHYVVVRTLLNQSDWEKFVWIEEHGSLNGFPG